MNSLQAAKSNACLDVGVDCGTIFSVVMLPFEVYVVGSFFLPEFNCLRSKNPILKD